MKKILKLTIFIFTIFLFHNLTYSQWVSTTSGSSNFLTSVQMISNTINYAAGFSGTVLKSTNNCQSWSPLTSPDAGNINKIFFVPTGSGLIGWTASVSGLYKSTNGGVNWTQQVASTVFADLLFPDVNTGIGLTTNNSLRRTTNGGSNFTTINFTSDASIHGIAISIGNSSTYFILGLDNVVDTSFIFKSTNAGVSWTQAAKFPLDYFAMTFVNANTGLICGDAGIMRRTTNGGSSWTAITSGTTNDLQGIKFVTSTVVYCVGSTGTILKSTNAGANWVTQASGTTVSLRSIDVFSSDDIGITVGAGGTMRRTTNGGQTPTAVVSNGTEIPGSFTLGQNYPNPFNPSTKINFSIPVNGNGNAVSVLMKVYDILGNQVALLVNENLAAGNYSVDFNASSLPSGTYFYRLQAGEFTESKKMLLIK